jgi:hypothetical protein
MAFTTATIGRTTWKLHEARGRIQESLALRRTMLLDSHQQQLRNDRNDINSHIHRLQPGLRKAFLAMRLEKIKQQLK